MGSGRNPRWILDPPQTRKAAWQVAVPEAVADANLLVPGDRTEAAVAVLAKAERSTRHDGSRGPQGVSKARDDSGSVSG